MCLFSQHLPRATALLAALFLLVLISSHSHIGLAHNLLSIKHRFTFMVRACDARVRLLVSGSSHPALHSAAHSHSPVSGGVASGLHASADVIR
jgi:hypothetical protein